MTLRLATDRRRFVRIPRWLAFDRIGRAHAYIGRSQTALCGARGFEERFSWPRRTRCADCMAAIEAKA